ncbi:LTA synthase family protein, partial [bacterium 210820-DFI.6.52]|nr:LTA synthase family protein [bacterium 210820-DFI.6.52]
FLFNLKSPLKGTASGMSQEILSNPIFKTVTLTTIFLIILNFNYDIFVVKNHVKIKVLSQRYLKLVSIALS